MYLQRQIQLFCTSRECQFLRCWAAVNMVQLAGQDMYHLLCFCWNSTSQRTALQTCQPDWSWKVLLLMITHIHTSCSAHLESLQKLSCAYAEKPSMANIVSKMCFQISGACSRQDMSGLLLLDLPPLACLHTDQCVEMCDSYSEWMLQDEPYWFTLQHTRKQSG